MFCSVVSGLVANNAFMNRKDCLWVMTSRHYVPKQRGKITMPDKWDVVGKRLKQNAKTNYRAILKWETPDVILAFRISSERNESVVRYNYPTAICLWVGRTGNQSTDAAALQFGTGASPGGSDRCRGFNGTPASGNWTDNQTNERMQAYIRREEGSRRIASDSKLKEIDRARQGDGQQRHANRRRNIQTRVERGFVSWCGDGIMEFNQIRTNLIPWPQSAVIKLDKTSMWIRSQTSGGEVMSKYKRSEKPEVANPIESLWLQDGR